MNIKLQDQLLERHSKVLDGCGIECQNGWYVLIDVLCHRIQRYVNACLEKQASIPAYDVQVRAVQVKEKFGGLRFYTNYSDDYVDGLIDLAEELSYNICEACGSMNNVIQTKGWIFTLCQDCLDKHPKGD